MRAFTLGCALLLGCAHMPTSVVLQKPSAEPAVGFTFLSTKDPLTQKPLKGIAFYPPETVQQGSTPVGPYLLEAREGVAIRSGQHPLVAISHGHAGSRLGHHDLAEHLARAGYIVTAVEHAGDCWNDQSAFGSDRAMLGRAYQVSATIDAVLADAKLGPHVDAGRIGVAGFSAGGYTALVVLGAQPDFSLLQGYCLRHPEDREICGLEKVTITLVSPKPMLDSRVKAGFVMAPLGIFFGPGAFEAVRAPVFLAVAQKDAVLLPDENADRVRTGLKTLAGSRVIPGAGHYVFLAPCTAELARDAAVLCEDPLGVDRVAVHAELQREAKDFFDNALGAWWAP